MKNYIMKMITLILVIGLLGSRAVSSGATVACGSTNDGNRCHTIASVGASYHTFGDRRMNYGVGNYGNNKRYFWMSGLNSTYQSYTRSAVSDWMNGTIWGVPTSISIYETTTQANALFEVVSSSALPTGTLGQTTFYLYNDTISLQNGVLSSNYGWARCEINVTLLESSGLYSGQKRATIAHELGHAMGLSHENCRADSVMCQYGYGRQATGPDARCMETINHIYG